MSIIKTETVQGIARAACEQMADGTRGMLAIDPWDDLDFLQHQVWLNVVQCVLDEARVHGLITEGSFW